MPVHHVGRSKKAMGGRMRFVTFRARCFLWLEKDGAEALHGFGFASDISEHGAEVFLDVKLPKGTLVRFALEEQGSTKFRGIVAWCRNYSLEQRFHGQTNLNYRVGLKLSFESEIERQHYIMACNDLRNRAAEVPSEYRF